MSQTVILNGQTFIIPDPNDDDWGQNVTDFLVAIPPNVLTPQGGSFGLTGDVDFGASFGLIAEYYKSKSSNVASTGVLRLSATDSVAFRDNSNSTDLLLGINGSNQLTFAGQALETGNPIWGSIVGTLSDQTDLQAALDAKQDTIGYTPENIANKSTNTSLGTSDTLYPSQKAVKTYVDTADALKLNLTGGTLSGDLTLSNQHSLILKDTGTHTVSLRAPITISGSYTLTYPTAQGAANTVLQNDGSGNYTWVTNGGGGGSGTVNAGSQYQLGYYAANGTTIDGLTSITASKALASDANGLPVASTTTATELGYVAGATSNIQSQINALVGGAGTVLGVGTIVESPSAPTGGTWAACDGASLVQGSFASLFAAIGHEFTKYKVVKATSGGDTSAITGRVHTLFAGSSHWVAIPSVTSTTTAWYSTDDGDTWVTKVLPVSVVSAGSTFAPAASNGTGTIVVLKASSTSYNYSTDYGSTWNTGTFPVSVTQLQIGWNGTNFITTNTSNGNVYSSTDGISWTAHAAVLPHAGYTASINWVSGSWMVEGTTGALGTNLAQIAITTSSDGSSGWTSYNFLPGTPGGETTDGTTLVFSSPIMYSTDGLSWLFSKQFIPGNSGLLSFNVYWNGLHWITRAGDENANNVFDISLDLKSWYTNAGDDTADEGFYLFTTHPSSLGANPSTFTSAIRVMTTTTDTLGRVLPAINTSTHFNLPDIPGSYIRTA